MEEWLLAEQAWWDIQQFDPPGGYEVLDARDQKTRHIGHHVTKALGKLYLAASDCGDTPQVDYQLGHFGMVVRAEVMPDCAIYRSQLTNLFPEVLELNEFYVVHNGSAFSRFADLPPEEHAYSNEFAATLQGAMNHLADAASSFGEYIEPREHGRNEINEIFLIRSAIDSLNFTAEMLATHFDLDLAQAQRTRMESLIGKSLPDPLVQ